MSRTTDDILLDAMLIIDPDAAGELGPSDDSDTLDDATIKGSRLLIVRRKVQAINLGHGTFGAIEIECSLQPAPGLRFTQASLIVRLDQPNGTCFVDIAPSEVTKSRTTHYGYKLSGNIIEIEDVASVGKLAAERASTVVGTQCVLTGTGGGSDRAEWRLVEDRQTKQGIGTTHTFLMTVPVTGRVGGRLGMTARIARVGKTGGVRDLILGRTLKERWIPFEVVVPAAL